MTAWHAARRLIAARAFGDRHLGDPGALLSPRQPLRAWIVTLAALLGVYFVIFSWVHVVADTRICQIRLNDPLFAIVPLDTRWFFVTQTLYVWLTVAAFATLLVQAALGDHRPLCRWAIGLTIMAMLRACTILLVPLCRANIAPGTVGLRYGQLNFVHVLGMEIPWRPFARNDLLFSGHVGELILLLRATRSWPRAMRAVLWLWQALQIYALLAVRGHYTVDILLAFPCAYFADFAGVSLLAALQHRATTSEPATAPARSTDSGA